MSEYAASDGDIILEIKHAQKILDKHLDGALQVQRVGELTSLGNGYSRNRKCYIVDCCKAPLDASTTEIADTQSCFLILAQPEAPSPSHNKALTYHLNTLDIAHHLLFLISSQVHPPDPSVHPVLSGGSSGILDTSLTLIPYHYLLSPLNPFSSSPVMSFSKIRSSGQLSQRDLATLELRIGYFFGQLHSQVQNDWFGMPVVPPPQPSTPSFGIPGLSLSFNEPPHESGYSWQETFTTLIDDLLLRLQREEDSESNPSRGQSVIPYEDIRRCLSRAIGSFLFDDVEVPSLVWFTGWLDDIYVIDRTQPHLASGGDVRSDLLVTIFPPMTHAIWGDPLLEEVMHSGDDLEGIITSDAVLSEAFMEGYRAGGGKNLIVFPRHKTKRLWYTLFLALIILVGDQDVSERFATDRKDEKEWREERKSKARDVLEKCAMKLKDAPCY